MGVFDVDPEKGLTLIEIAPDTRQQLQQIQSVEKSRQLRELDEQRSSICLDFVQQQRACNVFEIVEDLEATHQRS